MATNNVITDLSATNWNGQFNYQGATGSFSADGQKILNNINGQKDGVGSFDANRWDGQNWNYNPHFSDPTKAAELVDLMTGAIAAIQAELGVD